MGSHLVPVGSAIVCAKCGESKVDEKARLVLISCFSKLHTWRDGRVAEGGGLLNRYTVEKPYPGFESLSLRQFFFVRILRNVYARYSMEAKTE